MFPSTRNESVVVGWTTPTNLIREVLCLLVVQLLNLRELNHEISNALLCRRTGGRIRHWANDL